MLNRLDDFPIHQTSEPVAHPATSDRNFYDRTWFNGYSPDGSCYSGIGFAIYPHRGIMDCAFSVVTAGGLQHCFYASRRAPLERTELVVGPFRLHIVEPMRVTRVVLQEKETGISCDLTFSARTACIEEGRQALWSGTRRVMDATRFDQFGRWSGSIRFPGGERTVSDRTFLGTKDRSWGVRRLGEREPGGAPVDAASFFFLWAPLVWDDHVSHAIFFDDPAGRPLVREALIAPLYAQEADVPAVEDGKAVRFATARHRVRYVPGTRFAQSAQIDLVGHDDAVRTIEFEPMLCFQMKGLGYGHPEWGQGMWQGEQAIGYECFDPARVDPLSVENVHIQQVVRVSDGTRQGTGVLEQLCFGRYAPAGFVGAMDGAA